MLTVVPLYATFGQELSRFGVSRNGAMFNTRMIWMFLTLNQVRSTTEASIHFVHKVSTWPCINNASYKLNGIHMTGKMYGS